MEARREEVLSKIVRRMQNKYLNMVNRELIEDICREVLKGKDKIETEDLEALESAIQSQ
jgi:hypothetical protein